MADETKTGGGAEAAKKAAEDARKRAEEQKQAQAAKPAEAAPEGAKVAPTRDEARPGGQDAVSIPREQFEAIMSRLAALEQARAPGQEGVGLNDPKSTLVLAPGGGAEPRHALPGHGSSTTTAPDGQPRAHSFPVAGTPTPEVRPEAVYVSNARVLLTGPTYILDAIRNEGETLEGYTGPLNRVMVTVDENGRKVDPSRYAA